MCFDCLFIMYHIPLYWIIQTDWPFRLPPRFKFATGLDNSVTQRQCLGAISTGEVEGSGESVCLGKAREGPRCRLLEISSSCDRYTGMSVDVISLPADLPGFQNIVRGQMSKGHKYPRHWYASCRTFGRMVSCAGLLSPPLVPTPCRSGVSSTMLLPRQMRSGSLSPALALQGGLFLPPGLGSGDSSGGRSQCPSLRKRRSREGMCSVSKILVSSPTASLTKLGF